VRIYLASALRIFRADFEGAVVQNARLVHLQQICSDAASSLHLISSCCLLEIHGKSTCEAFPHREILRKPQLLRAQSAVAQFLHKIGHQNELRMIAETIKLK
jgi:hypothetical protein